MVVPRPRVAEGLAEAGAFPDAATLLTGGGIAEHDKIISLIEEGDVAEAVGFAQRHMEDFYTQLSEFQSVVTATTLAGHFS